MSPEPRPEPFHKRQPVLAGCLGCLALGLIVSCGAGALMTLGGKALFDKGREAAGVDGIFATVADAQAAGFGFAVNMNNGTTTFAMEPITPQTVTCDRIQQVLFPHLTGTLETVVVESANYIDGEGGAVTRVPLTCTWSGSPNKDTPLGTAAVGASVPASLDPPPGLLPGDDDDSAP